MNREEYEEKTKHIKDLRERNLISNLTKLDLEVQAYCNYWLTKNSVSFKKKFDTSYWATSSEFAQEWSSSPSNSQSVFPPEMIASCVDESLPPFCFEMNGIMVKLDESLQKYVLSSPPQLYYHSKELRPMTRSQYAAKVRWARLRGLRSKLEEAHIARIVAGFQRDWEIINNVTKP